MTLAWLVLAACGTGEAADDPWNSSIGTTVVPADDDGGSDESGDASTGAHDSSGGEDEPGSTSGAPEQPTAQVATISRPASITDLGGGAWELQDAALADVGHAFYAEYGDDYDFLVVYTEGDLVANGAFAYAVQYDIGGLGFDVSGPGPIAPSEVGSAGRLRQINMMNTPMLYAGDPGDASVVVHETTHHYAAFIELPGTPTAAYLLDESWSHWNVHVDTGGASAVGYGTLTDLGDGRFEYRQQWPLQLSSLELYLAGLLPASEVGPMFYVTGGHEYDPPVPPFEDQWRATSYGMDATFRGTRVDFTIDDVIAANGPRTPAFGEAPTSFRFAFVLVCEDASACVPDLVQRVDAQRVGFEAQLPVATGGRATADARL